MTLNADLFGGQVAAKRAIGGHQHATTGQDEWLTPPNIIDALGPFDLDPCAPVHRPWPTASIHHTVEDDGLRQPWHGIVWLNPPYSSASRWMARLARHGSGIALLFARVETALWHNHVWPHATNCLFLRGRLHFHHTDGSRARGNSGAPSALVAYGQCAAARLAAASQLAGQLVVPAARLLAT